MSISPTSADLLTKMHFSKIEELNLSVRSYNSLKRAGIESINQVIDLGEDEVLKIRNLGQQQLDEIFDSVAAFLGVSRASLTTYIFSEEPPKNEKSGEVEIKEESATLLDELPQVETLPPVFQDTRPFIIEITPDILPNLVEVIVPFSKLLLEALKYNREFEVIKRRFGLEGSKAYTLQEVGYYYDLTRERVRQLESQAESKIRDAILGISKSHRWRVPQNLIDEANTLLNNLQAGDAVLTEEELIQIAEDRYQFKITTKKLNNVRFLLTIFGFRALPKRLAGFSRDFVPGWIVDQTIKTQPLFQMAKSIHSVVNASPEPISVFDLKIQLNKRRKKKIDASYFNLAPKVLNEIEIGHSLQIMCLMKA